jgi:hypothetical protein
MFDLSSAAADKPTTMLKMSDIHSFQPEAAIAATSWPCPGNLARREYVIALERRCAR